MEVETEVVGEAFWRAEWARKAARKLARKGRLVGIIRLVRWNGRYVLWREKWKIGGLRSEVIFCC